MSRRRPLSAREIAAPSPTRRTRPRWMPAEDQADRPWFRGPGSPEMQRIAREEEHEANELIFA